MSGPNPECSTHPDARCAPGTAYAAERHREVKLRRSLSGMPAKPKPELEPIALPLDPKDALRALLAVDPEAEPPEDEP